MDSLAMEREKAEFDVGSMAVVFAGGIRQLELSRRLASLVANDPVFQKDNRMRMSRKDLFKNGLRKAAHVREVVLAHNLSEKEAAILRLYVDEKCYADLHWNMFVPALEGQATDKQQEKWLSPAKNMEIIGCYAQTEIGHGSNVQGLETTATFDPLTDEFVLHSPTISSIKWWPGGLGKVATHALVQARLIIKNNDYGVHAFIVQIRRLEDHVPLPGITVGDIGMKFGHNNADNGFLRFDHLRIPRENMLMRIAEVTREGNYVRCSVPPATLYGALVTSRQIIISEAAIFLSRAVTIATRYSAVRRQFSFKDGTPEAQILDYRTQQQRLFPFLATTYAFKFCGDWIERLYDDFVTRSKSNDFSTLPEVHACTSGLKAITTSSAAEGIEECRKLCGGNGYLCSSGLPELYATYVACVTYEGDNIVLLRQVGRFLLKTLSSLSNGMKPKGTVEYLGDIAKLLAENCMVADGNEWLNNDVLLDSFKARAARLLNNCVLKISSTSSGDNGLDEYAPEIVETANAHCQLVVLSIFVEKLQEDILGKGVKEQLQVLFFVYALSLILKHVGDFLEVGYLTQKQVFLAKEQLRRLFTQVRQNAVALVDAFDYTDHFLGSTLGRYDGDVYFHLYSEAWEDPLNQSVIPDGYEEYISPILKQKWGSFGSRL